MVVLYLGHQMNHPPSETIGRKYWLAKTWLKPSPLCPPPEVHIELGEYSFSPADFDPTKLTLAQAREEGRRTTLFPPYGRLFGAQVWRMAHEAKLGDIVFLESDNRHVYAWGTITREYRRQPKQAYTVKALARRGIHIIGVEWHAVSNGKNAFRIGKGDNLLFREIGGRDNLLPGLLKLAEIPPAGEISNHSSNVAPDLEYSEGGKILRAHLQIERNSSIVQRAKKLARDKDGQLACETCQAVPSKVYGGLDLVEAHHKAPLSLGERKTKPGDFAMLCPNCHRAVHKHINNNVDPMEAIKLVAKLFT